MQNFLINDIKNMQLALDLATKGRYDVGANPMVGCVITKNNKVIASDYHRVFGEAHAEINTLAQINNIATDAIMYITLEPCSHHGKTAPCAQSIINSGIKTVFIATLDPNPMVNGKGLAMLQAAGIKCIVGLLEEQAHILNRGFIKRMHMHRPFVSCKIAMSLDGKSSMANGESKWISSKESRLDVQYLRAKNQAIITGSNTVVVDNPHMTVRLDGISTAPLRVVVDSQNKITDNKLNIFSTDAKTIIFNDINTKTIKIGESTKLDLNDVLAQLGSMGINNALLEAGPKLIAAMLSANLIDEFVIYAAPILLGSDANSIIDLRLKSITQKIQLKIKSVSMIGEDIKITAIIKHRVN